MSADDALFDWIQKKWFPSGVSKTDASRIGKLVRDLKVKHATVAMLERAHKNYRQVWPQMPDTPEAVVKHWDRMIAETQLTPTVIPGQPSKAEVRKRAAEREQWLADNWYKGLSDLKRAAIWAKLSDHVRGKHGPKRVEEIRSDAKLLARSMWLYEVKGYQ